MLEYLPRTVPVKLCYFKIKRQYAIDTTVRKCRGVFVPFVQKRLYQKYLLSSYNTVSMKSFIIRIVFVYRFVAEYASNNQYSLYCGEPIQKFLQRTAFAQTVRNVLGESIITVQEHCSRRWMGSP